LQQELFHLDVISEGLYDMIDDITN